MKSIKTLPELVEIDGSRYYKPLSIKEQLRIAKEISIKAHAGQFRTKTFDKDGMPIPYFDGHIEPVAKLVREKYADPALEIVAYLHDVLEDSDFTREDLIDQGIGEEIVCIVEKLTRTTETYFDKIKAMKYHHMARKVKLADLEHNMSDLKEGSLKDKYRFAHAMLMDFEQYWNKQKGKPE